MVGGDADGDARHRGCAVALSLIFAFPSFAEMKIVGVASLIAGDTIEILGARIRFNGLDAPESSQLRKDADHLVQQIRISSLEAKDSVDLERIKEIVIDRLLGLGTAVAKARKWYSFFRHW